MTTAELPLLVGVDGSESSMHAVDWAADEAARHSVPLCLLHAVTEWTDTEHAPDALVAAAAERARRHVPGVRLTTEVRAEEAADALAHAGRNALALVVGSRGRGRIAELLLGSVSLTVAGRADCPVVVVRGREAARRGGRGRVVLGVGDSVDGSPAARFAFRAAAARRCALHAVRAWHRPAHEEREHPLLRGRPSGARHREAMDHLDQVLRGTAREYSGVDLHLRAVEGPTRAVLLDEARGADLLVVGAHRRQDHLGLQLGAVGHTVLHHADCPVALVPEHI
ncbi:universal stress protein [Streptomyces carminius]|uniref:Universal stress protein n=1 Tax=Streptomyces carminius TaxID=2665496 RepID=A0A2M8MCH8_9ACTN|nr:universal stress protein [Streptomyces carminius]PJE98078.1 universal stress protein [Streptomyces carminius]PJF01903.1 universal stress protein [Streptomyces carminius]